MNLTQLAEPFPPADVEWRLQQAGKKASGEVWAKCLAYITNRAIQDRLDAVVGPGNWRNEYKEWTTGTAGVLCGLSIKVDEREWVTKWDGAEQTDVEAMKGGLSAAMKRAAVQWGIGRYLYDLPEGWAKITDRGEHYGKTKDGTEFRWNNPDLPKWALPGAPAQPPPVAQAPAPVAHAPQASAPASQPAANGRAPRRAELIAQGLMPIGQSKGQPVKDLDLAYLTRTLIWVMEQADPKLDDVQEFLAGVVDARRKEMEKDQGKLFEPPTAEAPDMNKMPAAIAKEEDDGLPF